MTDSNYVLGVDLDNVTAKYTEGLRNYMVSRGYQPHQMPEPTDYSFVKSGWPFKDIEDYLDHHIDFTARGGFLSLEPMEGASDVLHALKARGVRIRIITHRLLRNGTYAQAISDTARWLDHNNIPFHDFCSISEKSAVGTNLLVDDAPSNIIPVRENGGRVVVFDHAYNRHLDDPRVHSWEELYGFVIRDMENLGFLDSEQSA